ncbi:MAG: S26 family signal peptidase [Acidobacteriia bacterium]|nr:S26 family signal peptidase [Terriglobia bacterium]
MKKMSPYRNPIAEWAVTLLLLLFGTATVAQPFVVPTGSMEDTVLIGDHQTYVKRVIGVPGDRIRISKQQVYVNGKPLIEPYKVHKSGYARLPERVIRMLLENLVNGELLVPPTEHLADMNINVDHVVDPGLNFFSKTRWRRTFQLVRGYPHP